MSPKFQVEVSNICHHLLAFRVSQLKHFSQSSQKPWGFNPFNFLWQEAQILMLLCLPYQSRSMTDSSVSLISHWTAALFFLGHFRTFWIWPKMKKLCVSGYTPIPHRPRIPRIATNQQIFWFMSESYSVREDLNWFAQSVVSSCNS